MKTCESRKSVCIISMQRRHLKYFTCEILCLKLSADVELYKYKKMDLAFTFMES